jgi:hypothetical protein
MHDVIYGLTIDDAYGWKKLIPSIKSLPKRPTLRIICDEPGSGFKWQDLIEPVYKLSQHADIMIMLLDSYYMRYVGIQEMADRARKAIEHYGRWAKYFEVGNEIGGEWLGDNMAVEAKCVAALEVCRQTNVKTAVTWYFDGHHTERFDEAINMQIDADLQLVSWYPYYSPSISPDWDKVFQRLAKAKPGRLYGFGEFGTEHEQNGREVVAGSKSRAKLITNMHAVKPAVEGYVGGWFYWRGLQDILKPTHPSPSRFALEEAWRKVELAEMHAAVATLGNLFPKEDEE